jgi:hypothetical protein
MKVVNYVQIDFNKENDLKVPSVQYDSGSRFVKIKLQQNKVPFEINGYRVTVVANKVDGTEIMNDCTILDGANGLVEFEITEQFNAVEGVVDCQLKLFKGKTLLTSMPFSINVVKSVSTKEIVSSNELKTLVNALGEVQNIDNRFAQTNAQLSEIANKGTTVEVIERATKEEIEKQIDDGRLTNLMIHDNSITGEKVKNKSIPIEKLSFARQGNNKINNVILNEYINDSTGKVISADGWARTDYIDVSNDAKITIRAVRKIAFYASDLTYISGLALTGSYSSKTIEVPIGCSFVRFCWYESDLGSGNITLNMCNAGSILLPYEPYKVLIPSEVIQPKDFNSDEMIENQSIQLIKLKDTVISKNLFNKEAISLNSTVSNSSGNLSVAEGFATSDYCNIINSQKIFITNCRSYALYDENKSFIQGSDDIKPKKNVVINVDSSVAFIRFSWYENDANIDSIMLNVGDSSIPYEEFGVTKLKKEVIDFDFENIGNSVHPKLILPPKIYGVVGEELNIYYDNISNMSLIGYDLDISSSLGKQLEDKWTCIPTSAGVSDITFSLYKNFKKISSINTKVVVKDKNVGNGANRNAIIIGDSTIAQDFLINHLEDKFSTDGMNLSLLGTLGTYGEKHNEGRAGWKMHDYRTNQSYDGVVNPFFNPTTNDFDFSYYMRNVDFSSSTIDYVVLCLGINDTFNFNSDEELLNEIPTILEDFEYVINNILNYSDHVKVGVCVTIPPTFSQNDFGEAYSTGQVRWRYKRNNAVWIESLINTFKNKESERVYLIPENSGINSKDGFRDGVHPNKEVGDLQRSIGFYSWFKSFES